MPVPPLAIPRRSLRARSALLAGVVLSVAAAPAVVDASSPPGVPAAVGLEQAFAATTTGAAPPRASRKIVRVPRAGKPRAALSGQRVVLRWSRPRGVRATVVQTQDRTLGQKSWHRVGNPVRGKKKTLTALRPGTPTASA